MRHEAFHYLNSLVKLLKNSHNNKTPLYVCNSQVYCLWVAKNSTLLTVSTQEGDLGVQFKLRVPPEQQK